jgi:hypothetical protein
MGRWRIPLKSPHTELMRQGTAFWELLEKNGVHTRLFQIPANYPPVKTSGDAISGMGTPDLQGTSGTFTLYTDAPQWQAGTVSGGIIERVTLRAGVAHGSITGPPNSLLETSPNAVTGLEVVVDPQNPVALVRVGDARRLLQQGEWSEWLPVRFDLMPHISSVSGMVRFYLKQVRPHLMLYMTPVNIDPRDPAQTIAAPAKYAYELAEEAGPFYTEEMPEDTKALRAGVLTPREFVAQTQLVLDERKRLLDAELRRFASEPERSLMFFYFSSIDQRHHMLYREADAAGGYCSRSRRRHARHVPPDRRASRQGHERGGREHRNHRHVRPRLRVVPPASALESLAGAARLLAPDGQLQPQQVRVAARHRLVRDARLLDRPELAVPERARP